MLNNIQGFGGPPPLGGMGGPGGPRGPQKLTEAQQQTVQDLLEEYGEETLTAEDAKDLFASFNKAGIRGPGLREAIQEAGFDADQLFSLAHDSQKPPAPPAGGPPRGQPVNLSSLQSLQAILDQFDLENMDEDMANALFSQLNQAGLMRTGGMIDITT